MVIFNRSDAQVLGEKPIFGVEIRCQVKDVLRKGVGVGAGDREQRPFVGYSVTILDL